MLTRGDGPAVVLLVTHAGDFFTIDAVAHGLRRRGAEPVRLDTDSFPTLVRLSLDLDAGAERAVLHLPDGTAVAGADVVAVWLRKVFPARLPDDLDPALVPGCQSETRATLTALWGALARARFVDRPERVLAAEDKLLQLRLARAAGLRVPRTLVTNDPQAVRRLFDETRGRLVTKLQRPLSQSMGRAPLSMPTSPVGAGDLEQLDGLRCAPMVFQERVEKQAELRVACVGERCFTGAVDARRSRAGRVDWRQATPDECRWTRDTLPDDVQAGLRRLLSALGLRFGAADLIRTPQGEHVFLELNPAGEWGMLERDLGLPIGDALAEELLRP